MSGAQDATGPARGEPARGPGRVAAWKAGIRRGVRAASAPIVARLERIGLRPDHLSTAGLGLSVVSGVAFFEGHSRTAALLLVLGGLCDVFDGELARRSGVSSRFGAFLDSTLDRLSEAAVLLGILGFYLRNLYALVLHPVQAVAQLSIGLEPLTWVVMAFTTMLALVGSYMVSYTRARAEGLGLECKVGWFERPERLALIVLAGLLKVFWVMSAALLLLALLSFATAAQRIAHVHRTTRRAGLDPRGG